VARPRARRRTEPRRARLWGGRARVAPDASFARVNDSFPIDRALAREEIAASRAWAAAIARAGALGAGDARRLAAALRRLARVVRDDPARVAGPYEDVHAFVEDALARAAGDAGLALHRGRSRNDQVATDLRLWCRRETLALEGRVLDLEDALIAAARRDGDALLPFYTHLRRAQPIMWGHFLLAHREALRRDAARLDDARARLDECPLGSAAGAGSTVRVDRAAIARRLGFARPSANALDAVSDRDFVAEIVAAAALCGAHLSRLAEDLILYSSDEFGFVVLSDRVTTGSSLMPQKRNPDSLEIVRGKAASLAGASTAILSLMKGLPLSYNKDLQDDKTILFGACAALDDALSVAALVVRGLRVDRARMRAAAADPALAATDLADLACDRGLPFRRAHAAVGRLLLRLAERGRTLADATAVDLAAAGLPADLAVRRLLDPERLVRRRDVAGGTAPRRVREALARAASENRARRRRLAALHRREEALR
jgi:argininosuccinate lyase